VTGKTRHTLAGLELAGSPDAWGALGFAIDNGTLALDGLAIRFSDRRAIAIVGVPEGDIDGVPTLAATDPPPAFPQPNGVIAVDHFVIVTPDFDRTALVLDQRGLPLRRIRAAGGFRQGFRRLGPAVLELVEAQQMPPGPARFWGLTFIASDLDALAERLGPELLRPIKEAVQPGRRIATLDRAAGLKTNVAFMTPEP
jgi:hypothetical protein